MRGVSEGGVAPEAVLCIYVCMCCCEGYSDRRSVNGYLWAMKICSFLIVVEKRQFFFLIFFFNFFWGGCLNLRPHFQGSHELMRANLAVFILTKVNNDRVSGPKNLDFPRVNFVLYLNEDYCFKNVKAKSNDQK